MMRIRTRAMHALTAGFAVVDVVFHGLSPSDSMKVMDIGILTPGLLVNIRESQISGSE